MTAQSDTSLLDPLLRSDATFCAGPEGNGVETPALAHQLRIAFARNLRRARADTGLAQDELATLSGLPAPIVAQIEDGVRDPRLRDMAALASAVRRELWTLLTLPGA